MATKKASPIRITARAKQSAADKKSTVKVPVKRPAKLPAKAGIKNPKKEKVIRDSFTMPQNEYQKISEIKAICLTAGLHVKKSEVLRAGLKALGKLSAVQLKQVLSSIERVKTGRPNKR